MSAFIIAEIGINHNGDINIAKQLIKASSDANFDAVKFQKRTVEKVYTKKFLDSPRDSQWGKTQRDQKNGLELSKKEYDEIDKYCKSLNILWSASAWDLESQDFLARYSLSFNKVASPMLGNKPLIRKIAKEKKRTFVSTGMSTLEEIDEVVDIFKSSNCPFELMHCNSTYPVKEIDSNLLCIKTLRDRYKCKVGYSGHESSLIKVCVTAITLGASSIERHITLDRAMYGSDQAASIETHTLKSFVETLRRIPLIIGTGEKKIEETEIPIRKKLRVKID